MPARATRVPTNAKIASLAETIGGLDLDVLALQEVGQPEALADLVDAVGGSWHTALSGFPDDRGIRVAFMSKPAIDHVSGSPRVPVRAGSGAGRRRRHDRRHGPRGPARPGHVLRHAGRPRHVPPEVQAPLLSRRAVHPARRGRACTLRRLRPVPPDGRGGIRAGLRERAPRGHGDERAVIVLGDLNDEPLAATTQILLGPSRLGDRHRRVRPARPGRPVAAVESRLAHPRGARHSRRFQGRDELIDHILVSHALVRRAQDVDTGPGEPPSIDEQPGNRRDAPGSDHLPVVARFDLA